jgi:hypothetical protein
MRDEDRSLQHVSHIVCVDGEGHGAMEDSGGSDAFAYLKKVYNAKRRTKEMKETMKWYEETFDPAGFTKEVQCQWDKDKINSLLLKLGTRAIDDMDEDEDEDEDESESDIEADAEIKAENASPFPHAIPSIETDY